MNPSTSSTSSSFSSFFVTPGLDVLNEARARLSPAPYLHDWTSGFALRTGILAPALHVLFLSLFPALSFSAQLAASTDGTVRGVQVLLSTAIFGIAQAVIGGQPLLIVGVAEPLVLIYGFLYHFAVERSPGLLRSPAASAASAASPALSPRDLFLPWVGWVCVFSGIGCVVLALVGAARYTASFSRFSGESFGAVVAGLFFQQAIKLSVAQFHLDALFPTTPPPPNQQVVASLLALANGVFSLLIACGLVVTALLLRRARSARVGTAKLRGLVADYGAVVATVAWSAISFATSGFTVKGGEGETPAPKIPARLAAVENAWESVAFWSTASKMRLVPGRAIAAALLPAVVIIVLFFFDHGVSALMAIDVLRDRSGGGDGEERDGVAGGGGVNGRQVEEDKASVEAAALETGVRVEMSTSTTATTSASSLPSPPPPPPPKPAAYAYDLAVCGVCMVLAGLLGLPPTNGVLPQAPMHTHALSVAAAERARKVAAAAEVEEAEAEAEAEAAVESGNGAASFSWGLRQRRRRLQRRRRREESKETVEKKTKEEQQQQQEQGASLPATTTATTPTKKTTTFPLPPLETRVASLLQYLAIAACAFAGPLLRQIPRGAIAGYFAFMAIEWVNDSEMVDRLRWLCSDATGRAAVRRPPPTFFAVDASGDGRNHNDDDKDKHHAPMPPLPAPPAPARWTRAPTRSIAAFTAFQVACVALVYALTWVPVAGILFPVPIMLFVPMRTYLLPRLFGPAIDLLDGP